MLEQAWTFARWPAFISVVVTMARFFSERAGLPSGVSFLIGIFWLTLFVGIYFGLRLADEERPYWILLLSIAVFAVFSRIPVIILWWVTKTFGLGTHYDVFEGWIQALGAQLVVGVALQVMCGGIVGLVALQLKRQFTKELS